MSVRNRRFAVPAVIAATAIAVPVAALASSSDSPPKKPAHSSAATSPLAKSPPPAAASKSATPGLTALAASAGISVRRLQAGLLAAKRAGGNDAAGIAAFAASAHVTQSTARRLVSVVFESRTDRNLTGAAAAAVLVSRLGVSRSAAQHALQQISTLSGTNGIDPAGAAFARIAHELGVRPDQLAAALGAVKRSEAGK